MTRLHAVSIVSAALRAETVLGDAAILLGWDGRNASEPAAVEMLQKSIERPWVRANSIPALILSIACLSGCSSQQLYGVGQGWQRNECNRIIDLQERNRCMASTNTSYEEYKRQSEAAGGAKPP